MPGTASHQVTRTQTASLFQLDNRSRDALIEKNIPESNLIYYAQPCHLWDYEDMASSGLPRGVEALIWTWSSAKPCWMHPDDYVHLDNLRQNETLHGDQERTGELEA